MRGVGRYAAMWTGRRPPARLPAKPCRAYCPPCPALPLPCCRVLDFLKQCDGRIASMARLVEDHEAGVEGMERDLEAREALRLQLQGEAGRGWAWLGGGCLDRRRWR